MNEPYDNTNTGALFANDKGDNESRPDYRGKLNIEGTEYWISGWVKTPKSGGQKFLSLTVKPVEQQQAPPRPAPGPPNPSQVKPEPVTDDVDDIPF
jgi:hypothetical protein